MTHHLSPAVKAAFTRYSECCDAVDAARASVIASGRTGPCWAMLANNHPAVLALREASRVLHDAKSARSLHPNMQVSGT